MAGSKMFAIRHSEGTLFIVAGLAISTLFSAALAVGLHYCLLQPRQQAELERQLLVRRHCCHCRCRCHHRRCRQPAHTARISAVIAGIL